MPNEPAPYATDPPSQLILRDHLAIDRTALANERTFLAYIRTALTLLVVGASFIKFFDSLALEVVGWAFMPVGVVVFAYGVRRYRRVQALIHQAEAPADDRK
jgi:putative membrane protein